MLGYALHLRKQQVTPSSHHISQPVEYSQPSSRQTLLQRREQQGGAVNRPRELADAGVTTVSVPNETGRGEVGQGVACEATVKQLATL